MSARIWSTFLVGASGLVACQPQANDTLRVDAEWSAVLEGNGMQTATAGSVYEDRLVVAGTFDRELASGDQLIEGDGSVDAFIASFDSDSMKWLRTLQGPGEEVVQDVLTWEDGIIAVGLVSDGAVLLDSTATVADGTRPLLAELSNKGKLRTLTQFEGAGYSAFTKVARSPEGALFVGGEVAGRLELGATTIEGSGEAFVAQLDSAGQPSWVLPLSPRSEAEPGVGSVRVSDVKLAPDGSLYVAGLFAGGLAVGSPLSSEAERISTSRPPGRSVPSGRWTSSRTTSGRVRATTSTASSTSPASPTISRRSPPPASASSARTPLRNTRSTAVFTSHTPIESASLIA